MNLFNKTGMESGDICKPGKFASFLAVRVSISGLQLSTAYAVIPLDVAFGCQHVM